MAQVQQREQRIIDFPNRIEDTRPQWRQEVSARLRDFQSRRENRLEDTPLPHPRAEKREAVVIVEEQEVAPGVVSLKERKVLDVRVVRALQRIEKARAGMKLPTGDKPAPRPKVVRLEAAPSVETVSIAAGEVMLPPLESEPFQELEREATLDALTINWLKIEPPEPTPVAPEIRPRPMVAAREERPAFVSLNREQNNLRPLGGDISETFAPQVEEEAADEIDFHAWAEEMLPEALDEQPETPPAPQIKRVCLEVIDDAYLERKEAARAEAIQEKRRQVALAQGLYDDFAPMKARIASGVVDLFIGTAAFPPLAAVSLWLQTEWTWAGMFWLWVFSSAAFSLAYSTFMIHRKGCTWGQGLMFLCVTGVENGEPPSLKQAFVRSLAFIAWPLTFGLSLLYAFWDAEGRTLHDKLSGTIVLRA
jgi:uncharacterized RDD family membrane protein YckC